MKTILCFTVILFFLGTSTQLAQVPKNYDSVSVFLKNYQYDPLVFNTSLIQSISISEKETKRTNYSSDEVANDIGRWGIFALLIILRWNVPIDYVSKDSIDADWVISSKIDCKKPSCNWNVQIFAKGREIKEIGLSEKVVWWDSGATGIILQQMDTISRFVLLPYPNIDTIIKIMDPENFENRKTDIMRDFNKTFNQGSLFFWDLDFAIIGKFRGENFSAVGSKQAGKFWIFKNGIIEVILEQPKKPIFTAKKKSEEWSLLIRREDQNDALDYLRLSML